MKIKQYIQKFFKCVYKDEIKVWYNIMAEQTDIVISISDYRKATMEQWEIEEFKYLINRISKLTTEKTHFNQF